MIELLWARVQGWLALAGAALAALSAAYLARRRDGRDAAKVFEIETVNSLGTSRGQFEKHKFTFDAVTGEVTADLELTRGRWRADRIDADEDYQIVTDAAGNELIVKSEYERVGVEFEIFRDDNKDGIWAQIAEGEAGTEMLEADGTLDVSLLIPMLPADTGIF